MRIVCRTIHELTDRDGCFYGSRPISRFVSNCLKTFAIVPEEVCGLCASFRTRAFLKTAVAAAPRTIYVFALGGSLQVVAELDVEKSYLERVPRSNAPLRYERRNLASIQ